MNNFSNKAKILSIHTGLMRLLGWMMVLAVIVLSLTKLPSTTQTVPNSDKFLHLTTYFLLSYWFFHTYFNHKVAAVIGFILLGLLLEISQHLTPYRFFEWLDMLMNSAGVFLAYIFFWVAKIRIKLLLETFA